MTDLSRRLAVARGDEPAVLVLRGGRVLSVHTREWLDADVADLAMAGIAAVASYAGHQAHRSRRSPRRGPGRIDAHMHLESSLLLPAEFAEAGVSVRHHHGGRRPPRDRQRARHRGVHWLIDACENCRWTVFRAPPACPPPGFESPRRPLTKGTSRASCGVGGCSAWPRLNFPGLIAGAPSELAKLALRGAAHVDGHAPGVLRPLLQAYAAAGIGSDHESTTIEEARQRLRAGMRLLIREASGARNLETLLPLIGELGPARIAFCTDDREPSQIVGDGHINSMVRRAVEPGVDAGRAHDRLPERRQVARPVRSRRSRPATAPTCSCFPTWSDFCPTWC